MSRATMLSATTIVGTDVVNPDSESLGKIEDLVVDLEWGVVSYAILSYGGFMGMGNKKLFAVPWQAFTPSNSEDKFVLDVSEDTLKEAEGFDKDNWPEMDQSWGEEIHERYGYQPYWEQDRVRR